MARKVFFSFQYEDVQRAMNVRNSNALVDKAQSGFIDKAEFEEVQRQGDRAIQNWINKQLEGTTVTVVLVGATTDKSKWVQYEIQQSIARGNGLLTLDISQISDLAGRTTSCCGLRVPGYQHYRWAEDNGRNNLGVWVERAAAAAGK